jgi:polyvinyl alcohol dehydrogenase (cytochrome)
MHFASLLQSLHHKRGIPVNDHKCVNRSYIVLQTIALFVGMGHVSQAQIKTESSVATWPSVGQNLANTRFQSQETTINSSNANTLKVKWSFTTGGDVSATPTVSNNVIYAPDWAGNLFAISAATGQQIWKHEISEYNGQPGSISRVSPLVLSNEIIIGDNMGSPVEHIDGANIVAINPLTGTLKWITQVDSHPSAVITGSPVAFNNVVYVGVASLEELLASVPGFPCCTFRGSVVALDAGTGKKLWQTFTVRAER